MGHPTTPNVKLCPNIEAAREYANHLAEEVHALDFEVDGIVLKVNDFDQRQRMGRTSKSRAGSSPTSGRNTRGRRSSKKSTCTWAKRARSRPLPFSSRC